MSNKGTLRQVAVAVLLLVAMLCQGTWALAGTTGGLSGTVQDDSGVAIAGADVKVVSASETASATTDNSGHFAFLSLAPDTYTVSIEKTGFNPVSYAGVSVFADNQQSLAFKLNKSLKEIAKVSARSAGALVKAGTTSDVYSVNAATAGKLTGLGGGGGLDSAYSAIASVPGAFVPVGQQGWYQSVYIRGGDYDQVGYEVDGVPVNRSFDNYPSSTASALGQQEVQVYTGASPANAESQGLSGFINQVIKTGTYPGFATTDLGIGAPAYYHKANIEVGGASPDRLFSYYAGFGGYNQDFRYFDNNNGAAVSNTWGVPIAQCPAAPTPSLPSCYSNGTYQPSFYALGGFQLFGVSNLTDRENVLNFHFGIPHKHDGGRDDLQLLYQTSSIITGYYSSPNDWTQSLIGATNYGAPTFASGFQYTGAAGAPVNMTGGAVTPGTIVPYAYPSRPTDGVGGNIPNTQRDTADNGIGIVKLQYQKNFGADAYLRLYGYSLYSNWFLWGPNSSYSNYVGINPADYELESHTRGISATFAKQLNSKNLLNVQGSYTAATVVRANNTQVFNPGLQFATLVSSANPLVGICYKADGTATACSKNLGGSPDKVSLGTAASGAAFPAMPASCGGAPCEWLTTEPGGRSTYNNVQPKFASASITDEWDPTDRLHVNLGARFDNFTFDPGNTNLGPARNFWFNAWNQSMCVNPTTGAFRPQPKSNLGAACSDASNLGAGATAATLTNTESKNSFNVVQPRLGVTFTVNPQNVLRFSAGKYDQAPNSAFEQYNVGQQDLASFIGLRMYQYGRTSTTYPIKPETSWNTDFSWEHQVKGTDISFKLTPFYRTTKDQIQQFYLDQKTNFVSGLNVGRQTSSGVEFQMQKGDFSRNGLAGMLSYTYTSAKVKYDAFANGSSILTPINQTISAYNKLTKAGGGAACYSAGVADPTCAATGTVANPYYNAPQQSLVDVNGSYAPYDIFPSDIGGGSYNSFVAPHVATLVLNYKHDKFSITPALQYSAGRKYGYPLASQGVDPTTCKALGTGSTTGDPRYPYGAAGGAPYDASTCGTIDIPNPDSGRFDGIGAFTDPARLTMNMQLSYEVNKRVTAVATLANIFDTCFGGTKASWTNVPGAATSKVCGYAGGGSPGAINPVGNAYNPGQAIQPFLAHAYGPTFGSLPFNAYFDLKIKL